jgi:hypothetical protein
MWGNGGLSPVTQGLGPESPEGRTLDSLLTHDRGATGIWNEIFFISPAFYMYYTPVFYY